MPLSLDDKAEKLQAAIEDRSHMLDCLKAENMKFRAMLDRFYSDEQRTDQGYEDVNDYIIEAVERILSAGDWEDSLFLRNTVKPLKELKEKAQIIKDLLQEESAKKAKGAYEPTEQDSILCVLLYQSAGHDINAWTTLLNSLSTHVTGRPIYESEQDVNEAIKSKANTTNDAYVRVAVQKHQVIRLGAGKQRLDRLGLPLVSVAEGSILQDRIIEFVHEKKRYTYIDGKLTLVPHAAT